MFQFRFKDFKEQVNCKVSSLCLSQDVYNSKEIDMVHLTLFYYLVLFVQHFKEIASLPLPKVRP